MSVQLCDFENLLGDIETDLLLPPPSKKDVMAEQLRDLVVFLTLLKTAV